VHGISRTRSRENTRARSMKARVTILFFAIFCAGLQQPGSAPAASFRSESRQASGIALGGIGTGGIEIRPDGRLTGWNIFNNVPWAGGMSPETVGDYLPGEPDFPASDAFFGIRVLGSEPRPIFRVLALSDALEPDRKVGRRIDTTGSFFYPWLKTIESINYTGRYPFARLTYNDPGLPCRVEMEAMSPFVPLDLEESCLPVAVFRFRVHNPTSETMVVSLVFSVKNGASYNRRERALAQVVHKTPSMVTVKMTGGGDPPPSPTDGEIAIACRGLHPTGSAGWVDPWEFINDFRNNGLLFGPDSLETGQPIPEAADTSTATAANLVPGCEPADPRGRDSAETWRGAVADRLILRPGASDSTTFFLAWYFPHHLDTTGNDVGHHYADKFSGVHDVIEFVSREIDELRRRSREFVQVLYESSIPEEVKTELNSSLVLFTKSTVWTGTGDYGMWAGLGWHGLNATDHTYYSSWPQVLLFPHLEKKTLALAASHQDERGRIIDFFPGTFSRGNSYSRLDAAAHFVLQATRYFLWTGDPDFRRDTWPRVKKSMEYLASLDTDGNYLPNLDGKGTNYKRFKLTGDSSYLGSLYLCSLKAAEKVAAKLRETRLARKYLRAFRRASAAFDAQLWDPELGYYVLASDITSGRKDHGCMAEQLSGQWFADILGLGDLTDSGRIKPALKAIYHFNFKPGRGLVNGSYPGAQRKLRSGDYQWLSPSPGVEYAVASMMISRGLHRKGLEIVKQVGERYRRAGLTWNRIDQAPYSSQSLTAWTILLSLEGFRYDAIERSLELRPRCRPDSFTAPVITPRSWGVFSQRRDETTQLNKIRLIRGNLTLGRLILDLPGKMVHPKVEAVLNGLPVEVEASSATDSRGHRLEIAFSPPVTLEAGRELVVSAGLE